MVAAQKEIDLLPTEEFEKTRLGRFLHWALNFGRWIVIFTELIVILCFLSRFKLDRDLTDLGEKIKQQQAIIASFGDLEDNFRNLQKRLSTIKKLEGEQLLASSILEEVAQRTPIDVSLNKLEVREGKVEISALALSEAGLGKFIQEMDQNPRWGKLNLEKVTRKETGIIEFKLIAEMGKD